MKEDYPIFVKWLQITDWVMQAMEKLPKSARFTLANRIINLTLDILESIIEAIYTKQRLHILEKINLYMEKLRVLHRICYNRHYLSISQFEYISLEINEAGKMIGGWINREKKK